MDMKSLEIPLEYWIAFVTIMALLIGYELWRFRKNPHPIRVKEALLTSAGWIGLALGFNLWIYYAYGLEPGLNFFTGYLVEKSLSIDNLFIFLIIFSHFRVPNKAKHQVLFYGVLGAILMRALLIWAGITLVNRFDWIFIIFGLFLIYTAFHLLKEEKDEVEGEIEHNFLYRWLRNHLPLTEGYREEAFIICEHGKRLFTPLFLVLIMIELTDLIFALDSVPAILGITTDPFIVFTSNILAILGLRSLYFALERLMNHFYLLHYALAFILFFIGSKMILGNIIHIPIFITLGVIVGALGTAIIGSFMWPKESIKKK